MKRALLIIEFLILLGPAALLLAYGLLYLPAMLLIGAIHPRGGLWIGALSTVLGTWGLVSATNLAAHLIFNKTWPARPVQFMGLGFGVLACNIALLLLSERGPLELLVFGGPCVATAHFVFLERSRRRST